MSKIIIPGNHQSRDDIIDNFLKEWLTEKQLAGMPWFREMLDAYTTEVLLMAQKTGIERLLLQKSSVPSGRVATDVNVFLAKVRNRASASCAKFPLMVVPQKPQKTKVTLEAMENNDLTSDTKLLSISDVKNE